MAVNPTNKTTVTMYDQSSELTSLVANRPATDDLSAGLPTALTDFITAVAPIVDFDAGDIKSVSSNASRRVSNDVQGVGNREDKWLMAFQDASTLAPYNVELPMRSGGIATEAGSDLLPETTVATFRASAEAWFYSPDGNAGNLLYVYLIGRRS